MVLNDEQRQMVVDNEKLIWWTMKRFGVSDIDDIYSILALGLCKAACTYKKEKGEFSTWAITIMEMEIKLEIEDTRGLTKDDRETVEIKNAENAGFTILRKGE